MFVYFFSFSFYGCNVFCIVRVLKESIKITKEEIHISPCVIILNLKKVCQRGTRFISLRKQNTTLLQCLKDVTVVIYIIEQKQYVKKKQMNVNKNIRIVQVDGRHFKHISVWDMVNALEDQCVIWHLPGAKRLEHTAISLLSN